MARFDLRLTQLPEAVLLDDEIVISHRPEIATSNLDPIPANLGPGERPLGDAARSCGEMGAIAVVDVGDAFEAG